MPLKETSFPYAKKQRQAIFDAILAAGRAGKSHAQIAEIIGVGRDTLKDWIKEKPDLARVMARADDYALAWWEGLGQRQAETREGNATVFIFVMKHRFGLDYGNLEEASKLPSRENELAALSPETRHALRALLKADRACADD